MGTGLLLLAAPWSQVVFGVLCIFAGVVMAPALIIQSMLVARTAKPEHTTEAFTWLSSALLAGVGLGRSPCRDLAFTSILRSRGHRGLDRGNRCSLVVAPLGAELLVQLAAPCIERLRQVLA